MEKTRLVKLPQEKASRSDHLSFRKKGFMSRMNFQFLKILNQIDRLRDFQREEAGLVKWGENDPVSGSNGLDRRETTGSDFFNQGSV